MYQEQLIILPSLIRRKQMICEPAHITQKRVAQTGGFANCEHSAVSTCCSAALLTPHLSPNANSRTQLDNWIQLAFLTDIQLHDTEERSCKSHGRIQLLLQDPRQDPLLVHHGYSHLCKSRNLILVELYENLSLPFSVSSQQPCQQGLPQHKGPGKNIN